MPPHKIAFKKAKGVNKMVEKDDEDEDDDEDITYNLKSIHISQ